MSNVGQARSRLKADCANCFGLCCTALGFMKSADFALDKANGVPCPNLQDDYRCGIHRELRTTGFKGCTVYDCFGAGQHVSQRTFAGRDWKTDKETAEAMFAVFPQMVQLFELLWLLEEAQGKTSRPELKEQAERLLGKTRAMTDLSAQELRRLQIGEHWREVNDVLLQVSEEVRAGIASAKKLNKKFGRGADLIGAKLQGTDLSGANLRGAYLIAADLRETRLDRTDLVGADFRDADIRGADLSGSLFLTQIQMNAAKGDGRTRLPEGIERPSHWCE
ncbi:pentapeptide repeat-containing protein [Exiguobacterium flavidum]|uniref:pentapeptide repeat-containing protein n=1 Tax=Exiguobacterium flavidum TaxID=2184695 RepID=UPI001E4A2515|nr:pentapeptide repeat-containing protein [Exiguobacterium flavidum]